MYNLVLTLNPTYMYADNNLSHEMLQHIFLLCLELSSLAGECINRINDTGAVVVDLTCDNPASNWAMLEDLGARINHREMKVSINKKNILGIPIFVTLDACHLMKLLRNCFGTYQVFKDGNGETISWVFIEELNKLQEKEGVTLANKLRRKHVMWQKDKMRTKLALQLFSNSVASAIDYCRDVLKLKQFEGSEATSRFLRKFNDMFDVLNSKSKFGKNWSAPLEKNSEKHINLFNDMCDYILSLTIPNGKKLVNSQRCKPFVGFLTLMRSVAKIHEVYVCTGHLDYLLTFKMSQDHLETYFSSIRSSLGGNNNPTTIQVHIFKSIIRKETVV